MAHRLSQWREAELDLDRLDPDHMAVPNTWRVAARLGSMAGRIKEQTEIQLAREPDIDATILLKQVTEYAGIRRAEADRGKEGSMDCNQVRAGGWNEGVWASGGDW